MSILLLKPVSLQVYLNFAAKCNAGLWGTAEESTVGPDAKRRKLAADASGLVEADIDWENLPKSALPEPADPKPAAAEGAPAAPQAERPKPAPSSSIARPSIRLQPIASPPQPSTEGLEEYSPSRHGGESPPPGPPAAAQPPAGRVRDLAAAAPCFTHQDC